MRFEAEQFTFDFPVEDRPVPFEVEYKIAAFILMSLYRKGARKIFKKRLALPFGRGIVGHD